MILALIAGIILQVNILWLLSISGIIGAMTTYITLKKTSTKEDEN